MTPSSAARARIVRPFAPCLSATRRAAPSTASRLNPARCPAPRVVPLCPLDITSLYAVQLSCTSYNSGGGMTMTTYVLVPGAWLGGRSWRPVADQLRAEGHDFYPVTLTGLGERAHL